MFFHPFLSISSRTGRYASGMTDFRLERLRMGASDLRLACASYCCAASGDEGRELRACLRKPLEDSRAESRVLDWRRSIPTASKWPSCSAQSKGVRWCLSSRASGSALS
mmetsp:Transcript_29403/g.36054  ORF Transcript_29403/g.36054 Transcript_29403/m.36054 type:complete len:109 (+) Transcript_29403:310-636(+)